MGLYSQLGKVNLRLGSSRRKWKVLLLACLLIALTLTVLFPIRSVRALLTDTGVPASQISMDDNRVAGALSGGSIFVFDVPSGLSTGSFATPTTFNLPPSISGSKIVVAAGTSILSPTSIYYCTLPQAA